MFIQPYLNFEGRCEEAAEFYTKVLGAKVQFVMKNNQSPQPAPPGMLPHGAENKVLHMSMQIGDSIINATDGRCDGGSAGFKGITLTLNVKDGAEANRMFNGLADGGTVNMPLSETFFAKSFGMLTDRFGVSWMVLDVKPMQ